MSTPPKTLADSILRSLAGGLLLFTWLMVARSYGSLPPTIPMHFNAAGDADNWGPRASIWVLPGISTVLFIIFSLLHRYVHLFPQKQGSGDPERNLRAIRSLFSQLRLASALIFCVCIYFTLAVGMRGGKMGGQFLVPFTILIFSTPTLLFLMRVLRTRKRVQPTQP